MTAGLSPSDPLVGRVLAERYQILHRLGEGAMGVVYKARHVKVGRLFAVKVLHSRALQDSKVALRFEREAELAGRLRHPNVIGVVDVGEVDGTRYMVMDFAEGPDLARLLDEAPMRPERIIALVRQMLDGLHHAHEHGLIHRDFKPENVIIERNSRGGEMPRIVDFGIALLREGADSTDDKGRLTTNGLVLGTPHYMAPEQAVADPIDHRIDLFALGIVIYEMLSGRLPFDGSGAEVARANLLVDPPPINKRVPHLEVDPLLEAFARRLMAKKRDARPPNAHAARELLDLIERDRAAAAAALGIPVSRSGRLPAETERFADEAPPPSVLGPTAPMKPTPRPAEPVGAPTEVDASPAFPVGDPAAPSAPVVYAGMPVPAPVAAAPSGPGRFAPHRDTALRTPLGWQTASHPARRRSWLIGGLLVGALGVATAAVITLTAPEPEAPVASEPMATRAVPASSAATPSAAAPEQPPAPPPPSEPSPAAAVAAPPPSEPVATPVATPPPPSPRVTSKSDTRSERRPSRSKPAIAREPVAPSPATPAAAPSSPPPRSADSAPPPQRTESAPHVEAPAAPASGVTPAQLGGMFDQIKRQIEELPDKRKAEMLSQLMLVNILDVMRNGSQKDRDDAAVKLSKIRERLRERAQQ